MIQNKHTKISYEEICNDGFLCSYFFIVSSETQDLNIILWSVPFLRGVKLSVPDQSVEARYPRPHPLHALP